MPNAGLLLIRLHRNCPPRAFSSKALQADPYAMQCAAHTPALGTDGNLLSPPAFKSLASAAAPLSLTPTRAFLNRSNASVGQGAAVVRLGVAAVVCFAPASMHFRLKLPVPRTVPPAPLQADVVMHWPPESACLFLHLRQTELWQVWQFEGHVHGCGSGASVNLPLQTFSSSPPPPSRSSDVWSTMHLRLKFPLP